MATTITSVPGINPNPLKQDGTGGQDKASGGVSFTDILKQSLGSAVDAQHKSEQVSAQAVLGKASMTDVLQATNSAEIALNTVLAVRDRLVQAWQEIMRSQI